MFDPSRQLRRRNQRGFSLLELFYAMGYFTLGLIGLASFQIMASYGSGRAGDISVATSLVSGRIEDLRVRAPLDTISQPQPMMTYYDRFGAPLSGPPGFFTVSATATQPANARYFDLKVNATWKQSANDTFVHNMDMYTRIPTE